MSSWYFPLVPGTTAIFSEQFGRENRANKIAVTRETKTVMGVKCVVVQDTVTLDGVLREDAWTYFAQDKQSVVWFFGEAAKEFLSFGRVSTVGSWEAGINGAQPGIVMPGRPTVGGRFRKEYFANVAEWHLNPYLNLITEVATSGTNDVEATMGLGWQINQNLTLEQGIILKEGSEWELVFAWEWNFGGD